MVVGRTEKTAAEEAAERVTFLPPPASIESLLEEALGQCKQPPARPSELQVIIREADQNWTKAAAKPAQLPELTPVAALLAAHGSGTKTEPKYLKELRLNGKMKVSPGDAARQYLRELLFLRAMSELD